MTAKKAKSPNAERMISQGPAGSKSELIACINEERIG
jgi:hypothetical protein